MINLVDSVPVDYMHAVLEGWLTSLILLTTKSRTTLDVKVLR